MVDASERDAVYDLNRFVRAQGDVYPKALAELRRGRKESHWMWFIFPQFNGLGRSPSSKFYAIKSKDEAKAYLEHPVLGKRLSECSEALLRIKGKSAAEIFGYPDDLKLHSSMSLFASISKADSVFSQVLKQYFGGSLDEQTLNLMESSR